MTESLRGTEFHFLGPGLGGGGVGGESAVTASLGVASRHSLCLGSPVWRQATGTSPCSRSVCVCHFPMAFLS